MAIHRVNNSQTRIEGYDVVADAISDEIGKLVDQPGPRIVQEMIGEVRIYLDRWIQNLAIGLGNEVILELERNNETEGRGLQTVHLRARRNDQPVRRRRENADPALKILTGGFPNMNRHQMLVDVPVPKGTAWHVTGISDDLLVCSIPVPQDPVVKECGTLPASYNGGEEPLIISGSEQLRMVVDQREVDNYARLWEGDFRRGIFVVESFDIRV